MKPMRYRVQFTCMDTDLDLVKGRGYRMAVVEFFIPVFGEMLSVVRPIMIDELTEWQVKESCRDEWAALSAHLHRELEVRTMKQLRHYLKKKHAQFLLGIQWERIVRRDLRGEEVHHEEEAVA